MTGCSARAGLIALFFVVGMSQRMRLDHLCLESALSLKSASISSTVSSTVSSAFENLQTATSHTLLVSHGLTSALAY
jgi:hypothetical protein